MSTYLCGIIQIMKKKVRQTLFLQYAFNHFLFFFLCVKVLRAKRTAEQQSVVFFDEKYILDGSCYLSWLCGLEKSYFVGLHEIRGYIYFPKVLLFLITCSMSACSDVSSLMLYLARIFMMGRIFSHHCVLGMRCL